MDTLFLHLLNMSITASWLVLAVLLVRLLFRRTPKALLCALWAVVAIRLLCPFSVESVVSLIPSARPIPPEILYTPTPTIDSGIPAVNEAINPILSESLSPNPGDSINPLQIVTAIAANLWILGMVVMLAYAVISYIRVYRKVRVRLPLENRVYECDGIDTPFIFGIIKPHIYLPSSLSATDRSYVLAHERAHLKRLDHLWKPLGFALLTVYWFNPLLWVAYILLCRDIELACDERVIRDMNKDDTAAYTEALLHCSTKQRFVTACPLAFGESGVKARIKRVLHYKKPAFWIVIAAVIACIAVVACFLTNPPDRGKTIDSIGAGSELEGISVSVKEYDLSGETPSICILWHNGTQHEITYGESFRLYRLEAGREIDTNLVINSGFNAIGYLLSPYGSIEKTYDLSNYNLSQNGTYRFESSVNIHGGAATSYDVWVDFSVTDGRVSPLIAATDTYTIREEVLSDKKSTYEITYPVLESDTKDYEPLNTFLKNNLETKLCFLQKAYPKSGRIVMNYTITRHDSTLISVLFEGTVTPPDKEAVDVAFTACLAPGNGYTVNPESLFVMDDTFLNTFRTKWLALWDDANLTYQKGQEIRNTINGYSNEELAALLRDGKTADFGFTSDGVLIVFRGKPTVADYILMEIPNTTEAVTTTTAATTTEAVTTTTTAPPVDIALNTNLLSQIGKTYSEIAASYGELVQVYDGFEGGFLTYRLENSGGFFAFGLQTDWKYDENGKQLHIPTDENGNMITQSAPLPKADAPCGGIWHIPAKEVFLGLREPVTAEQLADMYGVTYNRSAFSQMNEYYYCSFTFEEFSIPIRTEDDFIITPDAIITLIKKQDTPTANTPKYTVNTDRLSEIGMTYAELIEKYSESAGAVSYDNRIAYAFAGGQCRYIFNLTEAETLEYSRAPKDINSNYHPPETMPIPPADRVCTTLCELFPDTLFNHFSGSFSPQELADAYGMELIRSNETMPRSNLTGALLRYGDYEILIEAQDNLIRSNSLIEYIKIAEE